jgi:hypothetical protein
MVMLVFELLVLSFKMVAPLLLTCHSPNHESWIDKNDEMSISPKALLLYGNMQLQTDAMVNLTKEPECRYLNLQTCYLSPTWYLKFWHKLHTLLPEEGIPWHGRLSRSNNGKTETIQMPTITLIHHDMADYTTYNCDMMFCCEQIGEMHHYMLELFIVVVKV